MRIEYEPHSVKELLTEMKDISESIIDLSYSAVIFNSEDIASEVNLLEERMDALLFQIRVIAILAARNKEEAIQMAAILQVAGAAEKISNAAGDIVKLLELDLENRPFIPSMFLDADEKIRAIRILDGSDLVDRTLGDLDLETSTGVRVIAIRRRKKWIYDVDGETRIRKGDFLVVRGVEDGFMLLKECAEGVRRWD